MFRENGHAEHLVTIGGTFDTLHVAHKTYIRLAFECADRVLIYVTSDEYVNGKKSYSARPYAYRVDKLEGFIQELECEKPYHIRCLRSQNDLINDFIEKPDLKENLYMVIISPEYYDLFLDINRMREAKGSKSFLMLVKPRSLNPTNNDISSHEVRKILNCPHNEYY